MNPAFGPIGLFTVSSYHLKRSAPIENHVSPIAKYGVPSSNISACLFDVALMNFNVIGYMTSNDDALGALGAARKNLRQNGLLIADFWYGPAVVTDPPGENTREFDSGDVRVVRSSSGLHLPDSQCCEIAVKVTRLQGDRVLDQALETHRVRYFFPLELELMLRVSGFQLLALTGFPDIDAPASARKWAAAVVAVAV